MMNMQMQSNNIALTLMFFTLLFVASHGLDYNILALEWPGSLCNIYTPSRCCDPLINGKRTKPAANFTIHGLWPAYYNGAPLEYCSPSTPYDRSQITSLFSNMQSYWPSLWCPSEVGHNFWSYEWKKHGTCSGLNQYSYFQRTIQLKNRIDLLQRLMDAGVRPDGTFHDVNLIDSVITQANGGLLPSIKCNRDSKGINQLFEIYLCVDSSALNTINCPNRNRIIGCQNITQFPVF